MIPPFQRTNATDRTVSRIQDAVGACLDPLAALPIAQGQQLTGVALAGGVTTNVAHGLGRPISGWFVTRQVGAGLVNEPSGVVNRSPELLLWLAASAPVVVDLWVY